MALIGCCGHECGIVSGVGSHFGSTFGAGTIALVTSPVRGGTQAVRLTTSANAALLRTEDSFVVATRTYLDSVYWRFNGALPTESICLMIYENATATVRVGYGFNSATGLIECWSGTTDTNTAWAGGGVAVMADNWFRVDSYANSSANPWTVDASVNGSALTQKTIASAAANCAIIGYGLYGVAASGSCTADVYVDDRRWSQTSGDHPIGAAYIKGYVPDADGTHNLGAAGNIQDAGGADINAASNPAFGDLDELPAALDANAVLFKTDTGGGTYIEIGFSGSSEAGDPTFMDALVAYKGAAANAYAGQWRISADAFAGSDTNALSPATGTTQRYMREGYATTPGTAAAWTADLFNAVTMRFGFGTDVTPDIQFDAAILEAAFAGNPPAVKDIIGGSGMIPFARS